MNMRRRNETGDARANGYDQVEQGEEQNRPASIKGDEKNIAILFFLYLLQGIPLGLMQAVPIILTNTGISYSQQAQFTLVNWPFSMKLLWAPIVDTFFWQKIGRRKSWLVPMQYLIGITMLFMSGQVDYWLGRDGATEPNMQILIFSFFCLNFLAATQDIAVDGWALTMLKRRNVGYASTCNSVGQTAGYFLGYVLFIALESTSFCNTYLREQAGSTGIVTFSGFLRFWGWVFLLTTTLVWVLKSEHDGPQAEPHILPPGPPESVTFAESYSVLLGIIKLKPIQTLAIILLTGKVAFSAVDSVSALKLIESGVPKEQLALLAIPLMPLQLLLPLYLSRRTAGPAPMSLYIQAYPYRLATGVLVALLVVATPSFVTDGVVSSYYYVMLLGIYCLHQVALYSMFVAQMSFFARISDPVVGGTYMTLVNTLANLGGNWPQTAALFLVEKLTYTTCSVGGECGSKTDKQTCMERQGTCSTQIDGYQLEVALCTVIGFVWLLWGRGAVRRLQALSLKTFRVVQSR